jgi:rhodanese-related sulfurtransferase
MLGQQNEMVGLGGIDRAISALAHSPGEAMRELCSCGKTVADCDYWGQVLPHAHHVKGAPMKEKYVLALSIFQRVFGEKAWPVDSTKHAEPIETLSEISERASEINKEEKVVIHCKLGGRSAKAIRDLEEKFGYTNLYNLKGGIFSWIDTVQPELVKY